MVFGNVFGGFFDVAVNPDEERDPPKSPTPITFPSYDVPRQPIDWDFPTAMPDFESAYMNVENAERVEQEHIDLLNIDIREPCSFDDMVPLKPNGDSYLPPENPTPPNQEPTDTDQAALKARKAYEYRLIEMRIDNETAFGSLSGARVGGNKRPLVSYTRNFWMGLESMSPYWDCSLDNYYMADTSVEDEQPSKRPRLNDHSDNGEEPTAEQTKPEPTARKTRVTLASGNLNDDARPTATGSAQGKNRTSPTSTPPPPESSTRIRYKGRRTHTGREMPDLFRENTIRAFVETTVWPFKSALNPPRNYPIVQFGNLYFRVRQSATVNLTPEDRDKARGGWITGPVMGVQIRPELDFARPGCDVSGLAEEKLKTKSRLDQIREISGLLQLAQERRREGRTEAIPGDGLWWTTTPRWGGGAPSETPDLLKDVAEQTALDVINSTETVDPESRENGHYLRKWAKVRKASPKWDPKTSYKPIGKAPSSPIDEVFMVSSLNTHISILKLTVHSAYTDALLSGHMPEPAPAPVPSDSDWCKPVMQRSQWFDLFDAEQRVTAFRMLWGVMAYLTRETGGEGSKAAGGEARAVKEGVLGREGGQE